MPDKETINDEVTVNGELKKENEELRKTVAQLQKELQDQATRYGKLFGLFANNIDYYLGNK